MEDDKEDTTPPQAQSSEGVEHVKAINEEEDVMETGSPLLEAEAASKTADEHLSGPEEFEPKGGCRQCCSLPHGLNALIACIIGSIAWGFTLAATNDCHFLSSNYLYCHPAPEPKPQFGTCGDCHCINGDDPCPTEEDGIPLMDMSDDWLKQLKSMKPLNPYTMVCNPYKKANDSISCTDPPQVPAEIELWETAVCGIKYNMDTLDPDNCPTEYTMITYDTEQLMLDDGAVMTHWGACGACSTTQDLAVYVEYPDLTAKGQECGVRGLLNRTDGIECFQEVGYTAACAEAWMFNVFNTRDHCFDVCVDFTFFGDGTNNGPPPECRIANCLLCDEQMSGVIFQTEAARSRRRSGLLSKIARDCSVILIVDHQPPCNVTQEAVANGARHLQSAEKPPTPEKWRAPAPAPVCVYIEEDLGIGGYADTETNNWLLPEFLLSSDEKIYTSVYNTCIRYDFRNSLSGFWNLQRDIFGAAYRSARAFAILAIVIGIICLLFMWTSSCIAYAHVFWKWMAGLLVVCGVFSFLTMVFFASDVCAEGCGFGQSAVFAIVAGVLWWIASFFCWRTPPFDKSLPRAKTCCCPEVVEDTGAYEAAYKAVPTQEPTRTDISITETVQSDGSIVVEKLTTYPNGRKSLEVTTTKQ